MRYKYGKKWLQFIDTPVVNEVKKMTRSMRYSRETKMIGETSIRARDTKLEGEEKGNGCCQIWGTGEVIQSRSKFNYYVLNSYTWPAANHVAGSSCLKS